MLLGLANLFYALTYVVDSVKVKKYINPKKDVDKK